MKPCLFITIFRFTIGQMSEKHGGLKSTIVQHIIYSPEAVGVRSMGHGHGGHLAQLINFIELINVFFFFFWIEVFVHEYIRASKASALSPW